MQPSVQSYCNLLVRSRLLTADEARAVFQRWQREAGDEAGDVGRFAQWLVANGHVTTYQASRLVRGRTEGYFVDQYKVLGKIEQGPQTGSYRAVHQLGQVVALKVLSAGKARDARATARFLTESRRALALRHPNVLRTFQVGLAGDRYFVAAEHLEGETLEDVLRRRGRLPPAEAVRLLHQALSGLHYLHGQGVVHRDLKPAHLVLVGPASPSPPTPLPPGARGERESPLAPGGRGVGGEGDQPETTDQATVKMVGLELSRKLPAKEDAGRLVGTPDYLAPEQARDTRAADIRADIYSLGCVLYQCLTGQPPFPDTNVANQLRRHANEPARPVKELNPAVPDGLQQIVNWMLAKDPAQRYPTPERAAQALQVFLAAGEPPRAPGTDPRMKSYLKWLEAHDPGRQAGGPTPTAPARQPKNPPAPASAAGTAAPVAAPAGFDVELVPFEQLPQPRGLLDLDRRDFLMLGLGGGGVLFALFMGWLLARVLRRTPEEADKETGKPGDKETDPQPEKGKDEPG